MKIFCAKKVMIVDYSVPRTEHTTAVIYRNVFLHVHAVVLYDSKKKYVNLGLCLVVKCVNIVTYVSLMK